MEAKGGIRAQFMWKLYEPWQIAMLGRMELADPERLETYMNTLWEQFPQLYESLAIAAVDQEELSVPHCAELLNTTTEEIEEKLRCYRIADRFHQHTISKAVVVMNDEAPARLAEGQISVWEVVREYRKLGSVERLTSSFPGLKPIEIAAAMKYAEQHPEEIESQIDRYESMLARHHAEYPYSL